MTCASRASHCTPLYLVVSQVAELDLMDSGTCSVPLRLGSAEDAVGPLSCDCVSNLYVCTPTGVQVCSRISLVA